MNKTRYLLLLFLNFIYSCKSATSASDASVTAGFIIIIIIFLVLIIGFINISYEESRKTKKIKREKEIRRKIYNSPEEVEKRKKKAAEKAIKNKELAEKHNLFIKNNPHLSNSKINLTKSIKSLASHISQCQKCSNKNFTVWDLHETSLTLRCDSCKRKSFINNEISDKIYLELNNYFKWEKYCKRKNSHYTKFKFNMEGFKSNTPIHRGIRFKSLAKEEIKVKNDIISDRKTRTITQKVKDKVWNRDGGKCVECGSNENLEFDHIIPHSKGGANTYRNIQLLCEPCNRSKSAKIG